jgi:hypothetical protein
MRSGIEQIRKSQNGTNTLKSTPTSRRVDPESLAQTQQLPICCQQADCRFNPGIAPLPKAINTSTSGRGQSYATTRLTLAALSPLGPCWHSNSTASPSFSVL